MNGFTANPGLYGKMLAQYLLRDTILCSILLRRLAASEHFTVEQMTAYQNEQVYKTLVAAVTHIPFHASRREKVMRNRGEALAVLKSEFPILDREQIILEPEAFYPKQTFGLAEATTGGTTGEPLRVLRTFWSIVYENAFNYRHWSWFGFRQGERRASLRGDNVIPSQQTTPPYWFYFKPKNTLFLSTLHLNPERAPLMADELERFAPKMLEAYPSSVYDLAVFLRERGHKIRIPLVFTGSEPLFPYQKALIEERIAERVVDCYGMSERVALATECEHGSMHVNPDYSYVELVDAQGKDAPVGNVVGTSFYNWRFPLVRYRLSDLTSWKSDACACGRTFPMFSQIAGREEDAITGSKGNDIGPLLYRVLTGVSDIRQCQIAQVAVNRLEIRVVPRLGPSETLRTALLKNLRQDVDSGMEAEVVFREEISRTRSHKFRWVVNEWRNGRRNRDSA